MITRAEKRFLIGNGIFLACFGVSIFLILQSVTDGTPPADAFALYFWVCMGWALATGGGLFVFTRRRDLWTRFVETDISLSTRWGLRVDAARRNADGRWVPIFAAASLAAFLLLAGISAAAFFYF